MNRSKSNTRVVASIGIHGFTMVIEILPILVNTKTQYSKMTVNCFVVHTSESNQIKATRGFDTVAPVESTVTALLLPRYYVSNVSQ